MLSRLKRRTEAAGAAVVPAWHPNFRNFERLPDTKVVRTAFFVNGVAAVVVIVLLGWLGYQELQIRELSRSISDWQEQIERDQPGSARAVELFKKYQTEAARVTEIDTFVKSRPKVSALLLHLAETLPADIALDTLELKDTSLRLLVTVRGAPDRASGTASAYVEQLRGDSEIAAEFDDVSLSNLNRNPRNGRLAAEFTLRLKSAESPKKP